MTERQDNQAAFRRMNGIIQTHPAGRFLAISGGKVIADAGDFAELQRTLQAMGNGSPDVLVVQAGIDYPENAVIFSQGLQA